MRKTYVLNKPALLTSKDSLLRFEGHDIVIPMAVLEDLRSSLRELQAARQAIARNIFRKLESYDTNQLMREGVILENGSRLQVTTNYKTEKVDVENISSKDERILQTCKGLMNEGKNVILICNDDTLRMKARYIGIKAEELKDRVFPQPKDQYKGYVTVACSDKKVDKLYSYGWLDVTEIYEFDKIEWVVNVYVNIKGENKSALGYFDGDKILLVRDIKYPYGIKPKNFKQRMFMHALSDRETPIVIGKGAAGTGKTFCSSSVGLYNVLEGQEYEQMLIARSVKGCEGEKIGFLPGDVMDKFNQYILGLYDNLERIYKPSPDKYDSRGNKTREYIKRDLFDTGLIDVQPFEHIRGRSIANRWFIIDEMQNVDPEFVKSIVSRAGENSKFIFLGDPSQIDSSDLSENYNGLVYLSEMMKGQKLCRQITFDGENDTVRSPLAQLAVNVLV